jgi:hypothetical protein
MGRIGRVGFYIAATDPCPARLDEDVIRGFELGDGAVFEGDVAWGVEDEGWVLREDAVRM